MRPTLKHSIVLACAVGIASPFLAPLRNATAQATAPAASGTPSAAASAAPSAAGSAAGADVVAKRKEEAKERFNKGLALMTDEAWDNAYVEFSASIELFPTRVALKNAAVCLTQLGRFDEALDMDDRLLKDFGTSLPPKDLEDLNRSMATLKTKVAYFTIKVNVDGATVLVDSRERGRSPMAAPIRVAGGTRVVRVVKEGYQPYDKKIPIASATTQTIDINLEKLTGSGRLKVLEATGKGAHVVVDGVDVGPTPYEGSVAPGKHSVLLKGEGNLGTQPSEANVVLDQESVLRLTLEELAAEARIETNPAGAAVFLDGVPLGQGTWEGRLRAGKHNVDAASEGYFRYSKSLDAPAGAKTVWRVNLDRDDNSPFWSKGRTRPFSVALVGGGALGFSMGGNYENCDGQSYAVVDPSLPGYSDISNGQTIKCGDRSRPLGAFVGGRIAFEFAPGLAAEAMVGYEFMSAQIARTMNQWAEQRVPVLVDITDFWSIKGLRGSIGISYAIFRKPIELTVAAHFGALVSAAIFNSRSGQAHDIALCDSLNCVPPGSTTKPGAPGSGSEPKLANGTGIQQLQGSSTTFHRTMIIAEPEVRLGYPISDNFSIGIGISALVVAGGIQPNKDESVLNGVDTPGSSQRAYNWNPSGGGSWTASGNLTSQGQESIAGTFVLPRASLWLKLSF